VLKAPGALQLGTRGGFPPEALATQLTGLLAVPSEQLAKITMGGMSVILIGVAIFRERSIVFEKLAVDAVRARVPSNSHH
jgi:hypothetical protein